MLLIMINYKYKNTSSYYLRRWSMDKPAVTESRCFYNVWYTGHTVCLNGSISTASTICTCKHIFMFDQMPKMT